MLLIPKWLGKLLKRFIVLNHKCERSTQEQHVFMVLGYDDSMRGMEPGYVNKSMKR